MNDALRCVTSGVHLRRGGPLSSSTVARGRSVRSGAIDVPWPSPVPWRRPQCRLAGTWRWPCTRRRCGSRRGATRRTRHRTEMPASNAPQVKVSIARRPWRPYIERTGKLLRGYNGWCSIMATSMPYPTSRACIAKWGQTLDPRLQPQPPLPPQPGDCDGPAAYGVALAELALQRQRGLVRVRVDVQQLCTESAAVTVLPAVVSQRSELCITTRGS